jgi:iron complex outermembrane recepter protein
VALERKALFGATAMALALGVAGPAFAQQQQAPQQGQRQDGVCDPSDPTDPDCNAEEEIVVTGSRIRRDAFTSSSPVEVITAEAATLEGLTDTADLLNNSTAVNGSGQINNFFSNFVVQGGPGVNTVSLRGLGSIRTLVMLNGRRLNPAGTRGQVGAVDLNTIPESMVERVEILLDGASSIYGSDAVAGVVNVITRDNLDGGLLSASGMTTFEGGGETLQFSGAVGRQFERGNVSASFEYFEREDLNIGDRDFLACTQDRVFDPVSGLRRDFRTNSGDPQCFGTLTGVINRRTGGAARFIQTPGSLADPVLGSPAGLTRVAMSFAQIYTALRTQALGNAINLLDPANAATLYAQATEVYRQNLLLTPQDLDLDADAVSRTERASVFLTGNWDVGANSEIYGEAMYNRRTSAQDVRAQLFFSAFNGTRLHPLNPFPNQIADSTVNRESNGEQTVDFYRGVVGIRGDLPFGGWQYDLYGQYGYSDSEYISENVETDRLLWALGLDATGNAFTTVCPAAADPGCVAFNPWAQTYVTGGGSAALDYIVQQQVGTTTYEQTLFQGTINGDLFELPAGPISAALGFEWREESIDDQPSADTQSGNLFGFTSAGRTRGTDQVTEYFGEVSVPLLVGLPFVEELSFDGSYRMTDYDSYGENETYKLGLNWQITPSLRVRGTLGTSYRAPALFELFLANQTGFLSQANIDPCIDWQNSTNVTLQTRCAADGIPGNYAGVAPSALIITGGGAGILDAETSDALTYGVIWRPSFADLSVAVDYYEIVVNDQVAQFGAANILQSCYTGQGDDFCTLFTRQTNPALPNQFAVLQVNNSYVNLNEQVTRGIDLTARFKHEFSFADLTVDLRSTWTLEDEIQLFVGGVTDFNSDVGDPNWTGGMSFRFDRGDWTLFWDVDMIGEQSDYFTQGGDTFVLRQGSIAAVPGAPAVPANPVFFDWRTEMDIYHDVSLRYRTDNWSLLLGVQNLFGEVPSAISTGGPGRLGNVALTSQNDVLGRRAFVEVTRSW